MHQGSIVKRKAPALLVDPMREPRCSFVGVPSGNFVVIGSAVEKLTSNVPSRNNHS